MSISGFPMYASMTMEWEGLAPTTTPIIFTKTCDRDKDLISARMYTCTQPFCSQGVGTLVSDLTLTFSNWRKFSNGECATTSRMETDEQTGAITWKTAYVKVFNVLGGVGLGWEDDVCGMPSNMAATEFKWSRCQSTCETLGSSDNKCYSDCSDALATESRQGFEGTFRQFEIPNCTLANIVLTEANPQGAPQDYIEILNTGANH